MRAFFSLSHWPGAWPVGAALVSLLLAQNGQAQTYTTGLVTTVASSLYHAGTFTNTATGSFTNAGSTIYYAGPGAATYTNAGSYMAVLSGSTAATDQFIGPGGSAGAQEIGGTAAPTFYNLVLANGATAPFSVSNPAGVAISNQLTLANGITTTTTTAAGALRLTNTGSQASVLAGNAPSPTTYVDGFVAKSGTDNPFTYPLGATNKQGGSTTAVGAAIYSPITLSQPGGTAIRYVADATPSPTVFATQGAGLQLKTVSSKEYYPLGTVGTPASSTITIPYNNFGPTPVGSPYVGDPSSLTIAAFDGTQWTNLSATAANAINTTAKTVTVTLPVALASTSVALALASTSAQNPLPVTLVAFTAVKQGASGLLSWRTASEVNSAYFEVQVSLDGTSWAVRATQPAAGTSSVAHVYSYLDALDRYAVPTVYYRLRQVDLNQQSAYSPVVTLSPDVPGWHVSAYPNPYATELTAQLTTAESGPVTFTLLDATGRVLLRHTVAGTPGTQLLALDAAYAVASGTYTLLVQQNAHSSTLRVTRK